MSRSIVMIHPGALGDVLLALPAMRRLRARYPGHRLALWANGSVAHFLSECRVVDDWIPLEGRNGLELFGCSASTTRDLTDRLERCDLAVAWMRDEAGAVAAALQGAGARVALVESPFSLRLRRRHQSDRFLEVLSEPESDASEHLPLTLPDHLCRLGIACLEGRGIGSDRPLVLVHPGSGSRHKCVNPEVLVPVLTRLLEEGFHPVILEGPADRDAVSGLLRHCFVGPTILRELDLSTVAAVLSCVQLFIGQDSGVTHLSALLGVPTVALFGPTDPDRWVPRGRSVTVVRGASCACRSWEAVSRCPDKPCLRPAAAEILSACLMQARGGATPRNPSRSALSPPTPYAKVAS